MKTKYQWKRYWTPPDGRINLTDDGFLEDPTDSFGKFVNPDLISLAAQSSVGCLILLGEPGIGKSTEIKDLYDTIYRDNGEKHVLWINLRDIPTPEIFRDELTKDTRYQNWAEKGDPLFLFLDSFDEGIFSFKSFANYFSRLLRQRQDKIPTLYLRLSCRTALWQSYLENDLQVLWEKENFKKYELCPLTKNDVITTLDSRGIDRDKFLTELRKKGVAGLAGKPLTLMFLMDVYEKNGQLPEKKSQIYSQGCELLIHEPDPSKRNDPTSRPILTITQKNAIAERIAVGTLIGGKPTITLDGEPLKGEVGLAELHGTEIINNVPVVIGDEQLNEVLNTGLFSSRGNGRLGWAHQTYGEFLAARYIARHKLEWKQVQSFLFHDPLKTGIFQVIPQLYEVCAWLASLDSSFFDNAVLLDPEFLLLSDANVLTDSQKRSLTEQLLTRLDKGELFDRWEIYNASNYKKLDHPSLAQQLEPYIKDATKGIVVRRAATEIASACTVTTLEELLVNVALSKNDDLSVRVRAVLAIVSFGSDKSRQALKPLAESGFPNDPEDELKGVVLRALWPDHISAQELFNLITPPRKRSFHGTYQSFVGEQLASLLRVDDILPGLEWIEKNVDRIRNLEYSLRKLSDAIMLKAWESVSVPEVLKKFVHIAYKRLKDFEEIVGEHALSEETTIKFQELLDSQKESRRRLIKRIVYMIQEENTSSGRKSYILLHHGKVRLVSSQDIPWLIGWLAEEKNEGVQKMIAELIVGVFDTSNTKLIDLIYHAREKNPYLKDETHFWFQSVELASETAKNQREQWKEQQSWQTRREKNEKEEILKVISPDKIIELLEKSEAGDMDCWWRLNNAMCMYEHELDEEDIRKLPGWKIIDEVVQKRIIECGKRFLLKQESKPEIWLGKGKIYFPAVSGYRAINIFYTQERDFIENQDAAFWKRWAPITLGMPLVSNDPENGKIIALAYKHAPDEVLATLDVLIDDEAQRYNGLLINNLLEDCLDKRMRDFLLTKAQNEGFNPKAAGEIVHFLLSHNDEATKDDVKSKIKVPLPENEAEKDDVLSAAASLLWNANLQDWEFLWNLMLKDNEFARSLVIKAHDSPLRGSSVLQSMSESHLADLYIWLTKEFSPEEYSRPEGAHTVTPQISIGDWRDSVLRVLMDKGTAESCHQIEKVAAELPQYKWIKQYTLLEARRITLQKSWQAPEITQIFELVENHDLRLVNSPDELMNIVLDSLNKFENKLQKGEHPQAIRLWNEKKQRKSSVISWPKDENRLSDEIKTHLEEDLKSRGIIVNREVEIKRGSKTDIHITVFGRDHLGRPKDSMKITIEVKGCWHDGLYTAMESQLVGQYLSMDSCRHGVYLVGWFICDKWNDSKDSRRQKVPKMDIEEARKKFKNQAQDISTETSFRVESVILDARL